MSIPTKNYGPEFLAALAADIPAPEREPKYFDIACRRIEDAQRQGRLIA